MFLCNHIIFSPKKKCNHIIIYVKFDYLKIKLKCKREVKRKKNTKDWIAHVIKIDFSNYGHAIVIIWIFLWKLLSYDSIVI